MLKTVASNHYCRLLSDKNATSLPLPEFTQSSIRLDFGIWYLFQSTTFDILYCNDRLKQNKGQFEANT